MQFALSQRQAMKLIAGRINFAKEERRLCGAEALARRGQGGYASLRKSVEVSS